MPDFHLQPLQPETRLRFDPHAQRTSPVLSAHALSAHLLWQDHFAFRWTETPDHFLLFAEYDRCVYMPLPPVGAPDRACVAACFDWMDQRNPNRAISRIENIAETDADFYRSMGFIVEPKLPEYVYRRTALASLKGDAYKTPRWACNAFARRYNPTDRPYNRSDRPAAEALLEAWARARMRAHADAIYRQMLCDAFSAHRRALVEFDRLGLIGWVIEAQGALAGYTFGFPLNRDTFCVALEVADPSKQGAAPYLFRAFARTLTDSAWVNTMDDADIANLRRVKTSYRPSHKEGCYLARWP